MDYRKYGQLLNQFTRKNNIKVRINRATFAYDEVRDYVFVGGFSKYCFFSRDIGYFHQFEEGILIIFYEHSSEIDRAIVERAINYFTKETGIATATIVSGPLDLYDCKTTTWAKNLLARQLS